MDIKMFRSVGLPPRVAGKLLLHSMPGRFEAIEMFWRQLKSEAVGAIVCLTEEYEIRPKSSKYAEALEVPVESESVLRTFLAGLGNNVAHAPASPHIEYLPTVQWTRI
jgi:hypothetical protein